MQDIFKNILKLNSIVPPEPVLRKFQEVFNNEVQPEWYIYDDNYEAVFYDNDREKIATLDKEANLIDIKENLPLDKIPLHIFQKIKEYGELMNLIQIQKQTETCYELIVRDHQMERFLILADNNGNIIEQKKL